MTQSVVGALRRPLQNSFCCCSFCCKSSYQFVRRLELASWQLCIHWRNFGQQRTTCKHLNPSFVLPCKVVETNDPARQLQCTLQTGPAEQITTILHSPWDHPGGEFQDLTIKSAGWYWNYCSGIFKELQTQHALFNSHQPSCLSYLQTHTHIVHAHIYHTLWHIYVIILLHRCKIHSLL